MGEYIVEIIALIALFTLSIAFMILITISQSRLAKHMDTLDENREMVREEIDSVRERLKKLEIKEKGND